MIRFQHFKSHSSSTKVDPFAGQIATKSSLFAFETLRKTATKLFLLYRRWKTANFAVDIERAQNL